ISRIETSDALSNNAIWYSIKTFKNIIIVLEKIHGKYNFVRNDRQYFRAEKEPYGYRRCWEGAPVAILNRNQTAFYCIPPKVYEALIDRLEDIELNAIADARKDQPEIPVKLDEL